MSQSFPKTCDLKFYSEWCTSYFTRKQALIVPSTRDSVDPETAAPDSILYQTEVSVTETFRDKLISIASLQISLFARLIRFVVKGLHCLVPESATPCHMMTGHLLQPRGSNYTDPDFYMLK